jgi:sulfide:quinone oxidoreductase
VTRRARVLIVGAGVAGLEALLALRALLGDRVDITIVSPETKFVNDSMAVTRSSTPARMHALPLEAVASDLAARWRRGALDRVEPEAHRILTDDGTELVSTGTSRALADRRVDALPPGGRQRPRR